MPKRADLRSILIIGSGPIRIGQGCEFDYSASQACRVLRREGLRVVLVNSNPATIMTDPEWADATYIEPLDLETVTEVIAAERPDALLPTLGGQTALNLAVELHEAGVLAEYGVELLGASVDAIRRAEDRLALPRRDGCGRAAGAPVRDRHVRVSDTGTCPCAGDRPPRVHARRQRRRASPARRRSSRSASPRASPRARSGRCSSRSRSRAGRSSSSR